MITDRIKDLVALKPHTIDQNSVKILLDLVSAELKGLGMMVTLLEYNNVHSLYAHPKGNRHSRLLLEGHIDVVPADNQPFRIEDDKLFGRGVYDMLFGAACYLELLSDLKDKLSGLDIGLMLTGDEEFGGFNGVQKILDDGYSTDLCILPDAGEGFGSLNIAAKGVYTLVLRVNGQAHHGSRPWEGDGAAAKLVHFLAEAESIFDSSDRYNSTMTIARIQAGDAENKGPAYADCTLDIRYKDKADLVRIKTLFNILFERFDIDILDSKNGDDYQLDLKNRDVVKFIEFYEKACDRKIKLTKAHGSSDARFFAAKNIPVIMLRPDGGGAHGDNEWISSSSIDKFYSLLKSYVLDILE